MQRIPLICLIVNWKRENINTAVLVPEFYAANSTLCDLHVMKFGPGFHCSNGSTLTRNKSVGLCVVMITRILHIQNLSRICGKGVGIGLFPTRSNPSQTNLMKLYILGCFNGMERLHKSPSYSLKSLKKLKSPKLEFPVF